MKPSTLIILLKKQTAIFVNSDLTTSNLAISGINSILCMEGKTISSLLIFVKSPVSRSVNSMKTIKRKCRSGLLFPCCCVQKVGSYIRRQNPRRICIPSRISACLSQIYLTLSYQRIRTFIINCSIYIFPSIKWTGQQRHFTCQLPRLLCIGFCYI